MRNKPKILSLALAIGLALTVSACASGEKKAEGPAGTKAAEQQAPAAAETKTAAAPAPAPAAAGSPAVATTKAATPVESGKAPATTAAAPAMAAGASGMVDLSQFEVIQFEFDKSDILPEYRDGLAKEADLLKAAGGRVMVEGHCDEQGTEDYNMALGERRAHAVKRYLASMGVAANNIDTISYGEERPVDKGHNVAAWKKNRRVQFSAVK